MSKPKIQPPTPPQLGGAQILVLLLLGQGIPHPLLLLVSPHVVRLGEQKHANRTNVDDDELGVAVGVVRLVVVLVDVVGAYAAYLDRHLLVIIG